MRGGCWVGRFCSSMVVVVVLSHSGDCSGVCVVLAVDMGMGKREKHKEIYGGIKYMKV